MDLLEPSPRAPLPSSQRSPGGEGGADDVKQGRCSMDETESVKAMTMTTTTAMSSPGRRHDRTTRISKACDMCRARKVKCDAAQPCRSCRELGVACTTQYVSRRRGPASKYAVHSGATVCVPSPGSDVVAASAIPAAITATTPSTDDIAPLPVLALLVDDFFTYIHPLIPFPHEPTFRQRFASETTRREPVFLALLAAMVGSLAASFPRSVRAQRETGPGSLRFPRASSMVACCRGVALASRGAQFYNTTRSMTTDDAATSYLLGLAAGYTSDWQLCRRFMAEAMSFVQEVGVLASETDTNNSLHPIDEQIGRRIYWILFLAARSMQQTGASPADVPIPLVFLHPSHRRPRLPAEVDDAFITAAGVGIQPPGVVSLLTGFNRVVQVYATMDRVGEGLIGTAPDQAAALMDALQAAKALGDALPDELHLPLPGSSRHPPSTPPCDDFYDNVTGYRYYPPAPLATADDVRLLLGQQPRRRRQVQYDIQKTNIYASLLATRSYYVERYGQLLGRLGDDDAAAAAIAAERDLIVRSLLLVLAAIPQCNMEPNGCALINKIRQVASTLLGNIADEAAAQLGRFLEILVKLERIGHGGTAAQTCGVDHVTTEDITTTANVGLADEEEERQSWANLREEQMRFAASGGSMLE
ncbi:fungal transcriptional regulatory protein [Grosmannia clavigera kw1407]|uniref:Fungal transcriptional regulatory protein n=1 Tax=Grosmannia clavigera (strain kw1407 / UAMH 11150) TaxID=655863 RepID=F0XEL1_GROCL|nr:fungal transcriptional regulatory protein [Grosmannia clavigera kw1407]EFX03532.1 fungal transcriptional regulatory protein [Grosmannia clavigera kw1407]